MNIPPPQAQVIAEYRTLTNDRVSEFDRSVNALLKCGWKLYNDPKHYVCESATPVHLIYTQTMVKYG